MTHTTRRTPRARGAVALAAAALALGGSAQAATVSINTPFMNLESRAVNSLNFTAGQFLRLGANAVTPNFLAGTTGLATTTNLVTGALEQRTINFTPSPLLPNFYQRLLPAQPGLLGPWTLRFTNGADSATAQVSLPAGAGFIPFVDTITLSGTSANPTFTWAPPAGVVVDGYRINIYDKSLVTPQNSGQVSSRNLQASTNSYTVNAADFTLPGYGFTLDKNYVIEISAIQKKNRALASLGNDNLASIARVYADFTPSNNGGINVSLPVLRPDGVYEFNMAVVAGQTYHIDPEVAVGYDYAIGAGNPNFRSVALPLGIGDGLFDIFGFDALNNLVMLADDWAAGAVFDFGTSGIDRFRVTGIETSAGLDPNNTVAFITAVTFTGNGMFTGTQTPITVNVPDAVPEPGTWALLVAAALGFGVARRRRPVAV